MIARPSRSPSDGTLLARIALGDEDAFADLVGRYERRFLGVAFRILGNERDAEDAVQLAFLRVFRKARDYSADWQGSTWLYRVVTNICVDVWRKQGRQPVVDEACEVEQAAGEASSAVLRIDVQAALGRLPPETRSVAVLRFSEELSYDEIARVRGVSVNTVKTQLVRAKRALRGHLKGVMS